MGAGAVGAECWREKAAFGVGARDRRATLDFGRRGELVRVCLPACAGSGDERNAPALASLPCLARADLDSRAMYGGGLLPSVLRLLPPAFLLN